MGSKSYSQSRMKSSGSSERMMTMDWQSLDPQVPGKQDIEHLYSFGLAFEQYICSCNLCIPKLCSGMSHSPKKSKELYSQFIGKDSLWQAFKKVIGIKSSISTCMILLPKRWSGAAGAAVSSTMLLPTLCRCVRCVSYCWKAATYVVTTIPALSKSELPFFFRASSDKEHLAHHLKQLETKY